jgi:TRAP transporter TAXI family solute receptor
MRLYSLFFLLLFPFTLPLSAEPIGMVTGSKTGTYLQFGKNIAAISKKQGVNVLVSPSKGSIDNIKRMMSSENAAFAIVQSDVLGYLRKSSNPKFRQAAKRLRLIFPFYNEEVHLFARKEIQSINDLQGKRVVVGPKSSGTNMTAWNILKMLGIKPAKRLNISINDGIKWVLKNKADAVFVVAGKPRPGFKNLFNTSKESVKSMLQNVHFVPLNDPLLLAEYERSDLNQQDYAFIQNTVPTVTVKALLVSFDFSSGRTPYYQQRCQQLSTIATAIRQNIDALRQKHHKKWNQVDLNGDMGGWAIDKCTHSQQGERRGRLPYSGRSIIDHDIECSFNGSC